MSGQTIITLTTDFGLKDVYVAVMKGVIARIHPDARVIDLTHHIPPQDIQTAGFQLACAYSYFPQGTIHVVVVDPGVGSARQAIAVQLNQQILVGPNNGVFSQVLSQSPAIAVVTLDKTDYWQTPHPSFTFHGRDIFAPVAAHLSRGLTLSEVGSPLPAHQLILSSMDDHTGTSKIQAIDHFGNLITSIPASELRQISQSWSLEYKGHHIQGRNTYTQVPTGEAIALIGSHGYLEIAINQGSAQSFFASSIGESVALVQSD